MDKQTAAALARYKRAEAGENILSVYGPLEETRGHAVDLWLCDRAVLAAAFAALHDATPATADDAAAALHDKGFTVGVRGGRLLVSLDDDTLPVTTAGQLRLLSLLDESLQGPPAAETPGGGS